jgi:hypothetical protein
LQVNKIRLFPALAGDTLGARPNAIKSYRPRNESRVPAIDSAALGFDTQPVNAGTERHRLKSSLVSIALAYIVACYLAFAASWFVPATTPPDLQVLQMTWIDHTLHFVIAPIIAPIVIYACTTLSFLWGVRYFPEGLFLVSLL